MTSRTGCRQPGGGGSLSLVPELPEVQALVCALTESTSNTRVARIDVAAISVLKTYDPPITALAGCRVVDWTRHGKFLACQCVQGTGEPLYLVLHLARGGWIRWRTDVPARAAGISRTAGRTGTALALRAVFVSDDGEVVGAIDVTEAGTQKRVAAYLVGALSDVPGVASLGPDPLDPDFTPATLHDILHAAGRAQLKGVLRDQSRIAGIGNAYSDEILHVAGISPYAPASGLSADTEERLYRAIGQTLRDAVSVAMAVDQTKLKAEKKAAMRVHGRTGQPCPDCADIVREVSFADSSLQYCPTCQTGGRILADRRMSRLLR